MIFFLGKELFLKKFFLNFIIILYLSFCFGFFNGQIVKTSRLQMSAAVLDRFPKNTLLYQQWEKGGIDTSSFQEAEAEFLYRPISLGSGSLYCLKERALASLLPELTKGTWCQETENEGTLNCLAVSATLQPGDEIALTLEGISYRFVVTGILKNGCFLPSVGIKSTLMTADNLFRPYNCSREGDALILTDPSGLPFQRSDLTLFFPNPDLSQDLSAALCQTGILTAFSTIRENTLSSFKGSLDLLSPISLLYGALGLLTLIGMICANFEYHKALFQIYFRSGLTRKSAVGISLGYLFYLLFGVLILGSAFFALTCKMTGESGLFLNNLFFSAGFFLACALVTVLTAAWTLRSKPVSASSYL